MTVIGIDVFNQYLIFLHIITNNIIILYVYDHNNNNNNNNDDDEGFCRLYTRITYPYIIHYTPVDVVKNQF
jgi:hypothetical protein